MKRIKILENLLCDAENCSTHNQNILERLLLGSVLTINSNRNTAFINYYVGSNTEEVDMVTAYAIILNDYIEVESGNWETRERHYISSIRFKNINELNSIKGIIKFKL